MSSSQNTQLSGIETTKKTKDSTTLTIPTPITKFGQKCKCHEARSANEESSAGSSSQNEMIEDDSKEDDGSVDDGQEEEAKDSDMGEVKPSGSSAMTAIAIEDDQVMDLPESLHVKSQMARDIHLILSELVWSMKKEKGKQVCVKGRWFQVCL